MNTYRLESKRPFVAEKVNLILQAVMAQLEDVQYDPSLIPKRCIDMAGEIRNKVKLLGFDRYKLVVVVDIGEKNFQGVCSAFRFLWDCERDNYTYHKFENMFLYAVASVFGVYYD
ncbi:dynein light chain Tctex-type protein 2B [Anabrus simplex]|uniref:dynein light chain Tctex-type protein 2B n=1 Tax=Anabrus simplex TaxID=316456 RepID=UPI0034DCEE9E